MASTSSTSSADNAHGSILQRGFWHDEDAVVGKRVDRIIDQGFHFKTEEGLDFCKVSALDDTRIRSVIESFFEWSALSMYKAFGRARRDHCILNRTTSEMHVLLVQLWSSGSQMVFQEGSHLHTLNAVAAPNGLLAIPSDRLKQPGITETRVDMANGGFAIVDARLGFRVLRGNVIVFAFLTRDELKHWAKMPLPANPVLIQKVEEMESEKIGTNFEFVGDESKGLVD